MQQKFNVLGVGVCALNMEMALATIERWISERTPNYITITGVHGVIESQFDEEIRQIHNRAGLVTPDGMPLVWLGRRAGFDFIDRVYGPDLMLAICNASSTRNYRHFFYGGNDGVPELLRDKLVEKYPKLNVVGTYSAPFRPLSDAEQAEIAEMINHARPDIVWVGLGTPKQERWMAAQTGRLSAPVLIGVGAAFDFHAGLKKQAPRWIQRSGFEWLYRTMAEPRRLAGRYLRNNSMFLLLMALQMIGLKRYEDDWPNTENENRRID